MTLQRPADGRPTDRAAHRRQREWEIAQALDSLRHAQARLELLTDRADDVRALRGMRDDLASELARLDCHHDVDDTPKSSPVVRHANGFDTIDDRDGGRNDR